MQPLTCFHDEKYLLLWIKYLKPPWWCYSSSEGKLFIIIRWHYFVSWHQPYTVGGKVNVVVVIIDWFVWGFSITQNWTILSQKFSSVLVSQHFILRRLIDVFACREQQLYYRFYLNFSNKSHWTNMYCVIICWNFSFRYFFNKWKMVHF